MKNKILLLVLKLLSKILLLSDWSNIKNLLSIGDVGSYGYYRVVWMCDGGECCKGDAIPRLKISMDKIWSLWKNSDVHCIFYNKTSLGKVIFKISTKLVSGKGKNKICDSSDDIIYHELLI